MNVGAQTDRLHGRRARPVQVGEGQAQHRARRSRQISRDGDEPTHQRADACAERDHVRGVAQHESQRWTNTRFIGNDRTLRAWA